MEDILLKEWLIIGWLVKMADEGQEESNKSL